MITKINESSGQPPQSLENMLTSPKPNNTFCPKCGFENCDCERIRRESIEREAWEKESEAKEKKEAYEKKAERELRFLGGLRAYRDFTSEKFTDKKALSRCASFPAKNLFLCGPTGCGKTHLATALIRQQDYGRVWRATEILRRLRRCESASQEEEFIAALASLPIVVDDLGAEKLTEFAATTFWEIFDRRWLADIGGLIVTSNLAPDHLAKKFGDDRIVSRLAGMCQIIALSGPDGRLNQEATK